MTLLPPKQVILRDVKKGQPERRTSGLGVNESNIQNAGRGQENPGKGRNNSTGGFQRQPPGGGTVRRDHRGRPSADENGTLITAWRIDEKQRTGELKKAPVFEDDSQRTRQR